MASAMTHTRLELPPIGEPLLVVRGLSKRYGAKLAVDDFSISIPRGAIYGILGPNGAGKTTTIRCLMDIILATRSPRRRELLATLGLSFTMQAGSELDERALLEEGDGDLSKRLQRLALLKGDSVAEAHPAAVVISADLIYALDHPGWI